MDLAGIAALLALPTGLIAALGPALNDRAALGRLERVERILRDGSSTGPHRALLEKTRDRLTEVIALRDLAPKHRFNLWFAVWSYVYGAWMLAVGVAGTVRAFGQTPVEWYFWLVAVWCVAGAIGVTWKRWRDRRTWLNGQLSPTPSGVDESYVAAAAANPAASVSSSE